jgi:hypothetical protein
MKGVEFLRGIYASAGLSIRPKTSLGKLDMLKEFARLLGLNPEEIFVKEALSKPWRTVMAADEIVEEQIAILQERIRGLLGVDAGFNFQLQPGVNVTYRVAYHVFNVIRWNPEGRELSPEELSQRMRPEVIHAAANPAA